MKFLISVLMFVLFESSAMSGGLGDDTLLFYLSKSEMVIAGTISSDPWCLTETGVPECSAKITIEDVILGSLNEEHEIDVSIVELLDANANLIKKGTHCILFLRQRKSGSIPVWETVDVWFGIQHYPFAMHEQLKRLLADRKMTPNKSLQPTPPAPLQSPALQFANIHL